MFHLGTYLSIVALKAGRLADIAAPIMPQGTCTKYMIGIYEAVRFDPVFSYV
jgi:hypothetical protein